jgi:TetR/AcrR family tetracycline transcriptional repressor
VQTTELKTVKEPLTRTTICEAALTIIDKHGLDAVSMRSLAASLGVKAGSLYYHVRGKEDLLAGVGELLYSRLGPLPQEEEWERQVCTIFLQLEQIVVAHPNAAPLVISNLSKSPAARQRARALTLAVRRSGLDTRTCARLVNNLVALLAGYSLPSTPVSAVLRAEVARSTAGTISEDAWRQELSGDSEFATGMKALIKGFNA